MAISGKHAVAISTIRVRGLVDIEPGTVFEHEGSKEANRLYSMDAIREATDDEAALYDVRVKDGEIHRRTLSGEGDGVMAEVGDIYAGQNKLATVTADDVAAIKAAEAKAAETKAAGEKAAATKPAAKKADDQI